MEEEEATGPDREVIVWEAMGGLPGGRETKTATTGWTFGAGILRGKVGEIVRWWRRSGRYAGMLPPGCKPDSGTERQQHGAAGGQGGNGIEGGNDGNPRRTRQEEEVVHQVKAVVDD